jgi:hypothetical protein
MVWLGKSWYLSDPFAIHLTYLGRTIGRDKHETPKKKIFYLLPVLLRYLLAVYDNRYQRAHITSRLGGDTDKR